MSLLTPFFWHNLPYAYVVAASIILIAWLIDQIEMHRNVRKNLQALHLLMFVISFTLMFTIPTLLLGVDKGYLYTTPLVYKLFAQLFVGNIIGFYYFAVGALLIDQKRNEAWLLVLALFLVTPPVFIATIQFLP